MAECADESLYRIGFLTRVDYNSPYALTKSICAEFDIPPQRSLAAQNSVLEEFLLTEDAAGRTVVVFMDEGQQLSFELLEVIRNLLNFETSEHKLIQIVIAGQAELMDRIKLKRARAFASRVFSPVMIDPLSEDETIAMVKFRCERVRVPCPFSDDAVRAIYQYTGGVPRAILQLCLRATKQFPKVMIDTEEIASVLERASKTQLRATA